MIYIVCGLIGAGKSTWAYERKGIVTECEPETGTKADQIRLTLDIAKTNPGTNVYHLTTFPTAEELQMMVGRDSRLIWIGTSPAQAMENVIARQRPRDMADLAGVRKKNAQLYDMYCESRLPFHVIELFETDERW